MEADFRDTNILIDRMSIQSFFKRYLPTVKADEGEEAELVDPQTVLRVSDNRYIMFCLSNACKCIVDFSKQKHSIKLKS